MLPGETYMLTRRSLLAGAFAAAALLVPIEAQAASWVTLGSRAVNLFFDHGTIRVGDGAGLFKRLRLQVSGNTVFIRDMHVTFASGTGYDVPLRFMFRPGT